MRRGVAVVVALAAVATVGVVEPRIDASVERHGCPRPGHPHCPTTTLAASTTAIESTSTVTVVPTTETSTTVPLSTTSSSTTVAPSSSTTPSSTTSTSPPSPTTTPTSSTSTTTPPVGGFPDASNTGVPAGVMLTAYTGPTSINTPGFVIDSKRVDDCIQISAPGVVIRNSVISCPDTPILIIDDNNTMNKPPMLIEDSEVDCEGTHGSGIAEANFVARRVEIRGCENGLSVNRDVVLEDSWIHDGFNDDGAHMDGVQLAQGHWNGSTYVCCALNVTVRHNAIYAIDPDGDYGSSAFTSNRDPDENILIEGNLLAGGSYTLYCVQFGDTGINYRVLGNRFVPGAFGYAIDCSDEVQSGNVDHATGQPITLD